MHELRFRQVHLDFHTSELIPGVGEEFDAEEFARTLKASHVDSITCFVKCHHGLSYYDTKAGVKHPSLSRDLLAEMIAACRGSDIRVPVYISAGFDEHAAREHPEWLQKRRDGTPLQLPSEETGWMCLCLNTPYTDYLAAQTEEAVKNYDIDGILFDIVWVHPEDGCFCQWCVEDRKALGLDGESPEDLLAHRETVCLRFEKRIYDLVRSVKPDAGVFFNGTVRVPMRSSLGSLTHLEIESLPSGMWGYDHFPFFVRYCRTLGKPFLGMTARFHKSWADFGSLKNRAALEYECFSMLANGASCSIGDQMHPRGRLNAAVYELIGGVYESVARKEPWCRGAEPLVQVGLLSVASRQATGAGQLHPSEAGALRMLLQTQHQFDVIDEEADFSRYRVLVLPDEITVSGDLQGKLKGYLSGGGRLLASYRSGLDEAGAGFALPEMGVEYLGPAEYCPDYFRVESRIARDIPDMPHVMYEGSVRVKPGKGTKVLARAMQPYFNRTREHFCSHFQTPVDGSNGDPAATLHGPVAYVPSPVFRAYRIHGYVVYRQLVENLLELLLPGKLVRAQVPSTCQVTVMEQEGRVVVHLLHYIPQRRGDELDLVEDVIPLNDVRVAVRTGWKPARVYLAPQEERIDFEQRGAYTECVIGRVDGHAMLVLEK